MRTTRTRWLDEGLDVLASDGIDGLRIDRLAARLGVTKGSFHHHFDGIVDYRRALLAHYEEQTRAALASAISSRSGSGTRATLEWLTALVAAGGDDTSEAVGGAAAGEAGAIRRPELDAAVRAWAHGDPEARATQARIDAAAIAALQAAWRPAVESDAAARTAALVPYLVSLGAAAMVPPVEADELRAVYESLLERVPADDA
jgi:AcrR family transcriptional regulator